MRDVSPHSTNGKNGHAAAENGAAFSHSATAASTREYSQSPRGESAQPILITGGAGFVGTNLAHRLLSEDRRILVLDNLSRAGVEKNLRWLQETHGDAVEFLHADVRDEAAVREAVRKSSQIYHLAAQVAVTTSLVAPLHDFEVNARGTLNVLEAMRELKDEDGAAPSLVFTSTNKVYGGLKDVQLNLVGDRYQPEDDAIRRHGIGEARPLDFHSPYGCSKGAADQYVFDYARTFDLPAVVFRMSCIYGPHQCGTEDQGWVAHFLIRALADEPITLYGDGKQVRDILFVEDLVDAFLLAQRNLKTLSGSAFNIGGGAENTVSLRELLADISALLRREVATDYEDWRPGDQQYYVSDTRKFEAATGWAPQVGVNEGVAKLHQWLCERAETGDAAREMAVTR